jgi:putative two-component system response regulator
MESTRTQTTTRNSTAQPGVVMIVDDSPILRETLAAILELEGFQIIQAEDGLQALEIMEAEQPDIVLSDLSMPGMDGVAFFQAVRARSEWVNIPFIFLTAYGGQYETAMARELGVEDFLVKPVNFDELTSTIRNRLQNSRQTRELMLQRAYQDSLVALANTIETRNPHTRGHVERVAALAELLAGYLGWPELAVVQLRFAAILHDIGKLRVTTQILTKPSPLTEEEWAEVRQHPLHAAEMLKGIPYLNPASLIIRHHNERWDGQGYPDGLAGEAIPSGARLLAIANAFDAMLCERPYRSAFSSEEAYGEILAGEGSRYDPALLAVFRQAWQEGRLQALLDEFPIAAGE